MVKTGDAFAEHVIKDVEHRRSWRENANNPRMLFLPIFFAAIFILLFLRAFYLQIIKGQYYRAISDDNRTKTVVIHAPRGIIFDRNNKPLVFNTPGFRENIANSKTRLLTQEKALAAIANGKRNLEVDSIREYEYKDILAHVLGYVGQISENELKNPLFSDYLPTDLVGKDGIEKKYELKLKGIDGRQLFESDALGNPTRKLGQDDPIPGQNVKLTIDLELQKKSYEAMKNVDKGALVVTTPKGEILAMISKPSFDPNLFTKDKDYEVASDSGYLNLESILTDSESQPLLNRAIAGVYPPGSTFKLVAAAAALMNKKINKSYTVEDTGILRVGEFSFANWFFTDYGRTDGVVDVVKAIKRSNDIFFYKLAEVTGIDLISETAKKFGLGTILGVDLVGEVNGTLPTKEWKLKAIGEQWYLGDTYHYGIGQGYLLTTPLQVNSFTQAIAAGGTLYKPYLLMEKGTEKINANLLNDETLNLIRQGMIESCQDGGVAFPFYDFKVKNSNLKIDNKNILPVATGSADFRQIVVACKTGTAETVPGQKPHAWITLFAPAYNPEIVVTVLSEKSGQGSSVAGPIAKKVLEAYFSNLK